MNKEVEEYLKNVEEATEEVVREAKPAAEIDDQSSKSRASTHYSVKPIRKKNGRVYGRWKQWVTAACHGHGLWGYYDEASIVRIYDYPKTCANGNKLVVCEHN